jgi:mRNA interferase RelE/StbE
MISEPRAQQEIDRGEGCFEFIHGPLAEEPRRVGAPLRRPFEGHWWARRGEYRLRYTIDDDAKLVTVLDTDHRRDAYHR